MPLDRDEKRLGTPFRQLKHVRNLAGRRIA
jgi:hypothetical protein